MQSSLKKIFHEGETIQKNLTEQLTKRDIGKILKKFAALMRKGNVNAAINLLTESMRNGILPLNNETLNLLRCSRKRNVIRRSGKNTPSKV